MGNTSLVVVAMSGGVDSSVSAALLVEKGFRVAGMMLRLWSEAGTEDSNRCCTPDAMAGARAVARQIGIPFYAVDVRDRFRQTVVQSFLDGYARGETPNPCVVCNRQIRWGALYDQARAVGAEYLATGHYVRVITGEDGNAQLGKGLDHAKDQSYVLSVLAQEQLQHSLFPIGEYNKPEVRDLARKFNLPVAERPDSQDLCFLAGTDYRLFLSRHVPSTIQPGKIVDREGQVIGEHQGLAFYTIGQRKGIGIAAENPLYVIAKNGQRNELLVGGEDELGQSEFVAEEVNWISGERPADEFTATVKIRYKAREVSAIINIADESRVRVKLMQPLRDITPGQRAVFYIDDICLGGGTIMAG
jgi:tRNA-specific 2-thiouridylase